MSLSPLVLCQAFDELTTLWLDQFDWVAERCADGALCSQQLQEVARADTQKAPSQAQEAAGRGATTSAGGADLAGHRSFSDNFRELKARCT